MREVARIRDRVKPGRKAFLLTVLWMVVTAIAAPMLRAQVVKVDHLSVELVAVENSVAPGGTVDAGLHFTLEKGWHIYWVNAGDSGEPPKIDWMLPKGITADAMQFPAPKRLPLGPLMDFGYEDEVLFPITLHAAGDLKTGKPLMLPAKVDWLVCRERCIPGKANLTLTLQTGAGKAGTNPAIEALMTKFIGLLPKPLPNGAGASVKDQKDSFVVMLATGQKIEQAEFYPFDQEQVANAAPQIVKPFSAGVSITVKKDDNLKAAPKELHGLIKLADGTAYEVTAPVSASRAVSYSRSESVGVPAAEHSLLGIIALAFAGGLILNLMPCVFPVLFIKGLSLVQSSTEERKTLRAHGWFYTLGILVSFWAIVAVLLILRAGGQKLGWGFQFQSPVFVVLMAELLFFLGLSLAGQFEIGLSLTSAGGSLAQKSGFAGSFFTGVLATVVATPCTAPFMGAAIGFAMTQAPAITFLIFTALALGLAAPYVALTLQPAWTRLLPKPGVWMEYLKQATAIPIFGTVIWLVWVFVISTGTSAIVALLAGFLLLAIAGWALGRWPAKTVSSIVAVVIVAAAIAVPVYAAQEMRYSHRALTIAIADRSQVIGEEKHAKPVLQWQPYSKELVEKYRAAGKPVFIDFTAAWCLSCQVNERVVLNRDDVQQRLAQSGVELVRADWTSHDEGIAQALTALGRSGVPTYVLYANGKDGQVLPEVLTPGIVFDALNGLNFQKAQVQ